MKCQVPKCGGKVVSKGLCDKHRIRLKVHGHLESTRPPDWGKRNKHPLNQTYRWVRQRTTCGIVPEWEDFWVFAKDVGERPSDKHTIRRIDESKPYGPDNFFWKDRLCGSDDRNEYAKQYRKKNPIATKNSALKSAFGITIDDYHDMLAIQNGVCAICGVDNNGKYGYFSVDHCHKTLKIRGLLCTNCNQGIGRFKDSVENIENAIRYLSFFEL
jgi:hypothetical protein